MGSTFMIYATQVLLVWSKIFKCIQIFLEEPCIVRLHALLGCSIVRAIALLGWMHCGGCMPEVQPVVEGVYCIHEWISQQRPFVLLHVLLHPILYLFTSVLQLMYPGVLHATKTRHACIKINTHTLTHSLGLQKCVLSGH
jgi:hypothetical protein